MANYEWLDDVLSKECDAGDCANCSDPAGNCCECNCHLGLEPVVCKYGDPLCPCADGDMCHYEGPNPMKPPRALAVESE